jgi:hypothetical protein
MSLFFESHNENEELSYSTGNADETNRPRTLSATSGESEFSELERL